MEMNKHISTLHTMYEVRGTIQGNVLTSLVTAEQTSRRLQSRTSEWDPARCLMLRSPFSFSSLKGKYQKD